MKTYVVGQAVRLEATVLDEDDQVVPPTGVALLVFGPTDSVGANVAVEPHPDDANRLIANVVPNVAGVWRYRWERTDGPRFAREGAFIASPRTVPSGA